MLPVQTLSTYPVPFKAHRQEARKGDGNHSKESGAIPLYSDDQPLGGVAAESEETHDFIEGIDEDGNNVLLEVVRYFFYNGEEYVVLGDAHDDGDTECDCEHCHPEDGDDEEEEAVNLYIMKVVEGEEDGEEIEEFVPVEDEDLLEKLIEVVQADFEADEELDDE